jgi:subtilisin family serine protease
MRLRTKMALCASALATLTVLAVARDAPAGGSPQAGSVVRVLGARAERTLAPSSRQIGALVELPPGARAEDLGLDAVAPGIARLRGSAQAIARFSEAHSNLRIEVAPPLHTLLDKAGTWVNAGVARSAKGVDGTGVLVGVADTGLDVTHPDLLDENGKSRVAWILDLSLKPLGYHPELEAEFGIKDGTGRLVAGAVLTGAEIDAMVAANAGGLPGDEVGHGTHVTSLAAGNGGWNPHTPYVGMAPGAKIVFARVTRGASDGIENDDLVRGVQFIFDRADAEKKPVVANLSLGSDFGPHDGTLMWEALLASYVGPDKPGRALVVAAGNSGSIAETPVHQSVHVARKSTMRVPIETSGARGGAVQIWVAMRDGAALDVGLDGPDGTWIAPVADGNEAGKNTSAYNAGVVNGSSAPSGANEIPAASRGAVVLWTGAWPAGEYNIVLQGEGTADLFLEASGDAGPGSLGPAYFQSGVREGTINLPGTHPALIAVGCTVNRPNWVSIDDGPVALHVPLLDSAGGLVAPGHPTRLLYEGEVCWFSSAGPTVTGVAKPEISAPGGLVIAAMAKQAVPGTPGSVFTNPSCPPVTADGDPDPKCLQIDAHHAVGVGTSMSSPLVAGAIALLLQRDPTLTEDRITALLQAGAHRFRGLAPYEDQGGPGELDVLGALDALEQTRDGSLLLPSKDKSWLTLSADYVAADGSTPLVAILELRTADGEHRADMLGDRLQAVVKLDGQPTIPPAITRRAPGLYTFTVRPPPGYGGASLTFGATFDGEDVVTPKTLPVATDIWASDYGGSAKGGCASSPAPLSGARSPSRSRAPAGVALAALTLVLARRRSRP